MNKPFVRDNAVFIPAGSDTFILPEYRDSSIKVSGETLDTIWGFVYYGGKYRHRATDNPKADLAAVLAVYERNTAPKPKGPYVDGPYLHIPAGSDTLLLSEYVDADVWVAEDTLSPDWGYLDSCRKFRFSTTTNPKADLAKVMEVYERNTAPKPKVPYVEDGFLHIPADEEGLLLPDYRDPSVKVVGRALDRDWGYRITGREFRHRATDNPKQDLAAVLAVYEKNTNKDVVITITKLPPEPHPESGTEIPVPKCRVMLGIRIPDAASLCCSGLKDMEIFFRTVNPRYWESDYVKEIKCGGDTMSAAVATAKSYATDIRTAIRERKKEIATYNEKRAAAIAAADEEYERRANS